MFRYLWGIVLAIGLVAVQGQVRGESIIDHLPDDTVGFLVVRNVAAASEKVENVARIFQELIPQPVPAPLALMKGATGLGPGIDEDGDALLAFFPGDGGVTNLEPMLLLSVADYAAYANSINGDATGEICRVTIAGQEVLTAKWNAFIVLMNVEQRDRLEALLSREVQSMPSLDPLREWLSQNDVAVVLTPAGVDAAMAIGAEGMATQRAALDGQAEIALSPEMQQVMNFMSVNEAIYRFVSAELDAAAAGISVDQQLNVKLSTRGVLASGGKLARWTPTSPSEKSPLAAFPDEEFVFAMGGPLPPELASILPTALRKMTQDNQTLEGYEDFTEADWQKLDESWRATLHGVRHVAVTCLLGNDDDPLVSNIFSALTVENAQAYLEANIRGYAACNELLAKATSDVKLNYERSSVEIAGKRGERFTVDVAAAAADDRVPGVQAMWRILFGDEGKFNQYFVPAGDTKVVVGVAEHDADLQPMVAHLADMQNDLASSGPLQSATALLQSGAQWQGAVNLKGVVSWAQRAWDGMATMGGRPAPKLPKHPAAPPVVFSFRLTNAAADTEMAWHVETLRAFARFLKELEKAILAGA